MPHPNDMTQWPEIGCQRGHDKHFTINVPVRLGQNDSYHDYPRIPKRFYDDFEMLVWRWRAYQEDGPYCPGHDVVSEVIETLGVWEQCETAVMLMVFERVGVDAWFIDFGSQVGWYSVLAARRGLNVLAFDGDHDCANLTYRNLHEHSLPDRVGQAVEMRIGANVDPLVPGEGWGEMPIVVKIDVEGAEEHAMQMLSRVIDDVDFALIEISPVFNDSYPALVARMISWGFEPYEIPPRGDPPVKLEQLADLIPFRLTDEAIADIPNWHQKNVLMARGGL